jgi:hypothetical protein
VKLVSKYPLLLQRYKRISYVLVVEAHSRPDLHALFARLIRCNDKVNGVFSELDHTLLCQRL